jgi:hypothetical protein
MSRLCRFEVAGVYDAAIFRDVARIRQTVGVESFGLTITENTFWGGFTTENVSPIAIVLGGNAPSDSIFRNWLISNNDISGVNIGFDFTYQSINTAVFPASLAGVEISQNSVVANYNCVPVITPCYNVLNSAPATLNVANNW